MSTDHPCLTLDVLTEVRRDEFDSRPAWMFEELGLARPSVAGVATRSRDVPVT